MERLLYWATKVVGYKCGRRDKITNMACYELEEQACGSFRRGLRWTACCGRAQRAGSWSSGAGNAALKCRAPRFFILLRRTDGRTDECRAAASWCVLAMSSIISVAAATVVTFLPSTDLRRPATHGPFVSRTNASYKMPLRLVAFRVASTAGKSCCVLYRLSL